MQAKQKEGTYVTKGPEVTAAVCEESKAFVFSGHNLDNEHQLLP